MKQRILSVVILIILVFNILLSNISHAATEVTDRAYEDYTTVEGAYTVDSFNALNDDGSAQLKSNDQNSFFTNINVTKTMPKTIIVYIVMIADALPVATHALITALTNDGYNQSTTDSEEGNDKNFFTIESLVKNYRQIFDANIFNANTDSDINNSFKENIALWYGVIRNLAIILALIVLIYIGIRMAISTVATDKALYKKMLISWFEGFLLIWALPYLLSAAFAISDLVIDLINNGISKTGGFENTIITNFYAYYAKDTIQLGKAIIMFPFGGNPDTQLILWSIAYCILVVMQVRFLIAYAKRFLSVGFLILISPLVTITYSIDKAGDGRAQGYENLLKELMVNIFIQPIHIIIFEIFIMVANNIANTAPIIAIAFLFALSRVEKIIKTVFNMRGMTSIHSIGHFLPWRKRK